MKPVHKGFKHRVCLVHLNAGEAAERAEWLRGQGFQVDWQLPAGPAFLRALADDPPAAILIDLSRRPSQGRDLAIALRVRKGTRGIPLVIVGGAPDKVQRLQELLPDAAYTTWETLPEKLERAIANPPNNPVVPDSVFAGYSGKPLVQKLGIKKGMHVALAGAPRGFERTLGKLPGGVMLHSGTERSAGLTLWFTRSNEELQAGIERMAREIGDNAIWIAWPKKASGLASDLTQGIVRETGLAAGLVDYKICAIDETWSALLFTRRKKQRE